jgi:hypothetical protein
MMGQWDCMEKMLPQQPQEICKKDYIPFSAFPSLKILAI